MQLLALEIQEKIPISIATTRRSAQYNSTTPRQAVTTTVKLEYFSQVL
ncbi:MAG: hypothetical protein ACI832_003375 [Rheinheimera aquimaris]|jgi:hypothetical protein|tara:strand:- start:3336 stop:3479 length:144 start_codon:yes stop_codon:yes gene_type:complete